MAEKKPTGAQLRVLRDVKAITDRGEYALWCGNETTYPKRTMEVLVFERGWLEEYPGPGYSIGYRVRLTDAGRQVLATYKEG